MAALADLADLNEYNESRFLILFQVPRPLSFLGLKRHHSAGSLCAMEQSWIILNGKPPAVVISECKYRPKRQSKYRNNRHQ